MERSSAGVWITRGLAIVLLGALVAAGVITWRFVEMIGNDFLAIPPEEVETVEILEVAAGRVVLAGSDVAARPGIWGISGEQGYGQLTTVTVRDDGTVERGLVTISGMFQPGDFVSVEAEAFPPNPRSALGLPFEEIRVPGDLGVNPAWLVSGQSDTWIVFVHGRMGGRSEVLRSLSTFRKLGLPVLAITYRNDGDGGITDGTGATWGLDEWRDLEVALDTARLRGANDFVLVGHDMGADIVMAWLHESPSIGDVRGVVIDSPILDLEALVDAEGNDRGYPAFIATVGKDIARIRFGLEWADLDQIERAAEFDPSIPILFFQGSEDAVAPADVALQFVEVVPGVRYELVAGASHGAVWNTDPGRYDDALTGFLSDIEPGLELEP